MASKVKETSAFIVRIRSRVGTWRIEGLTEKTTVKQLKMRIRKEKKISTDTDIVLSLDPPGRQPAADEATLRALKIRHGSMIYAQLPKSAMVPSKATGRKIVDGKIVEMSYDDRTKTEGFRPGLMALRSMKMHWTLTDFSELDAKYTFNMKGDHPVNCRGVSLYSSACQIYQRYVKSMAYSPRVAHLYGKRLADKKIQVEVFYEPPQEVDEAGCAVISSDENAKIVAKIAQWLGLERVGFAFCHTMRDYDEVGYRLSAYELLEVAEHNLSAIGGDLSGDDPFAVVVVTGNEDGKTQFDAYEISKLSLDLIDRGALLEDEEEAGLLKVNDTYTVIVEARSTKKVSTYRCIKAIPILQHGDDKCDPALGCSFPPPNRPSAPSRRSALRAHLANAKALSHVKRVSDFHVLLALVDILGEEAVRELCETVRDQKTAVKEGYKLILDSLLH